MLNYTDYDTRLGAYAIIVETGERADRVLLTLWNEAERPLWALPGGGVELDETVEQGAVREVREETGYDVELGRLLGVDTEVVAPAHHLSAPGRALRNVRVYFTADVVGGELAQEVDGTTDEARWFALDEVAGLDRVDQVDDALRLLAGR